MDRNGKVCIGVVGLIFITALISITVVYIHRSPSYPGSSAPLSPSLSAPLYTTISGEELVRLQKDSQDLQKQKEQLEHLEQEMDALKGNEVLALKEQVLNVRSENQRLQDDDVTWKQKSNSTSKKPEKVEVIIEQIRQMTKEHEKKMKKLDLEVRNLLNSFNGVSPRAAGVFGWNMLAVLLLLPLWV